MRLGPRAIEPNDPGVRLAMKESPSGKHVLGRVKRQASRQGDADVAPMSVGCSDCYDTLRQTSESMTNPKAASNDEWYDDPAAGWSLEQAVHGQGIEQWSSDDHPQVIGHRMTKA